MDGEERPSELTSAEAARARRRDRDAEAKARRGMRTGLAKQFKQVLDTQVRRAAGAKPKTAEPKGDDSDAAATGGPGGASSAGAGSKAARPRR